MLEIIKRIAIHVIFTTLVWTGELGVIRNAQHAQASQNILQEQ